MDNADNRGRSKLIFICSKLRGDFEKNRKIAEELCRIVALLGHIGIAPHVYFTRFLDDSDRYEREQGIQSGMRLLELCDEVWVFNFEEISEGMNLEINKARELGIPIRIISDMVWEDPIDDDVCDNTQEEK